MRRPARLAVLLLAATVVLGLPIAYSKLLRWKKFDVVEPGVLYRSGNLHDWQLRRAIRQYGIKTVFSFTFTDNAREQRLCTETGVRRYFSYLFGDGVGTDDPYLRFLQVVTDPENHPMLVHCSAGVQRTGGAVALYRIHFQKWEFDDAIAEMIAKGNKGKPEQINQLHRIHVKLARRKGAENRLGEKNGS